MGKGPTEKAGDGVWLEAKMFRLWVSSCTGGGGWGADEDRVTPGGGVSLGQRGERGQGGGRKEHSSSVVPQLKACVGS